mgnify:CR=1 FL=1
MSCIHPVFHNGFGLGYQQVVIFLGLLMVAGNEGTPSYGASGIYENRELEPTVVKSIARELVVDEKDVVEMNRRMGGDKSLNVAACDDSDEEKVDFVVDSRQNIEENLGRRQENALKARVLRECLNEMDEREQYIIKSRMLTDKPVTLEEIGVKFGISRERVRQIEKKAFEKLSALVKLELAQKMC